jgi:PAS domain S-box-containing protein
MSKPFQIEEVLARVKTHLALRAMHKQLEAQNAQLRQEMAECQQAEEILRESEELYRITLTSISDAVFVTDDSGAFAFVCGNVEVIFGYSLQEVQALGNIMKVLGAELFAPAELERRGKIRNIERDITDRAGNVHTLLVTVKRVSIRGGTQLYVCRDITERKRAEEALQTAYDELERRVAERTAELAQANVKLKEEIIERKQAEKALRESEERYRMLFNKAAVPLCFINKESAMLDFNDRFEKTFGYSPEEVPTLNEWWPLAYPDPAYREWVLDVCYAALEKSVETKTDLEPIEYRVTCKNGDARTMVVFGSAIDQDYLLTFFDVTERKRMEESLRESERRYHSLFEDTPLPLWEEDYSQVKEYLETLRASGITDLRAYFGNHPETAAGCAELVEVLDVNKAALALVGARSREELLGRLPQGFTAASLQAFEEQLITLAEGGREFQSEATYHKLTGEEQVVLLHLGVAPGYESSLGRVLVSMLDVTERRQAEEALQQSEQRYRTLFEGAPIGLYRTTPPGQILDANPALVHMLGYPDRESLLAAEATDVYVNSQDRQEWQALANTEGVVHDFEVQLLRHDGRTIWGRLNTQVVRDADGEVLCYEGSLEDVTERRQAEDALARQNRRLEALYHAGQMINSTLEVDAILDHLVDEAMRVTRASHGQVLVVQKEAGCFERRSLRGFSPKEAELARAVPLSLGQGLSGQVYRTNQPVRVDDVRADPAYYALIPSTRAELVVPILREGQALGNLDLQSPKAGAFRQVDLNYLNALADQAAIALENARLYETEQRRAREAAAVSAIVQALNASTDLTSVFRAVSRELGRVVGFDRASLALLSDDQQHFTMLALSDREGAPLGPGVTMPTETTSAAADVLAGHPHLTPDLSTELDFPVERAVYEAGMRSRLNLPLMLGEVVIGTLNLGSRELNAFSAVQLPVLTRVAHAVAAAVQNARLYEEAQRRNRELSLLNRVIAASAGSEDVHTILAMVCRELALAFEVPQSAAALFNQEKTEAVVVAEYLAEGRPSALGEVIPAVGNPASQHLLEHKTPLAIDDAQTDSRQAPIHDLMRRRGTVSLLLLPLIVKGEVVGSLALDAIELRPFSAEEVALAQRVAEQVSGVLARARLEKERQRLEDQFHQAQKMEAMGRLAGGVAHDFNNLLTVIHLSTRLLERQLHRQDPLWDHVQRIRDACQRATNLTGQLLSFSRGGLVEPRLLDLNKVVDEMSRMLQRLIREDVELKTVLAEDLWLVNMDPTQVDQVVMNLAVNARDAMPEGGTLLIETANVVLDEAYAAIHVDVQPGEYVQLTMSDTGVGMSAEVQARLFEPFFTTKELGKGTGLGLATVYGIVKQNGGHIWVYSEVKRGTTFKIYLPRAKEGQAPARAPHPLAAGGMRGTETILVVEDDAMVRDLAAQILQVHGYQILTAQDGVEALRVSQEHEGSIHLLLTDLVMPQMGGRELAGRLRQQRPEMRVLFMSGYADEVVVRNSMAEEGVAFVPKPLTLEGLTQKVRAALDQPG